MIALLLCLVLYQPAEVRLRHWGGPQLVRDVRATITYPNRPPLSVTPFTRYTLDGVSLTSPEGVPDGSRCVIHYRASTGEVYWVEFRSPKGKE